MVDKKEKKTFDIKKPGKSAPSASSRPIIIKHAPMMQDPMVASEKVESDTKEPVRTAPPLAVEDKSVSEQAASSKGETRKKIVPIHDLSSAAEVESDKSLNEEAGTPQSGVDDIPERPVEGKSATEIIAKAAAAEAKSEEEKSSPPANQEVSQKDKPAEVKSKPEAKPEEQPIEETEPEPEASIAAKKDKEAAEEAARQAAIAKLISDKTYHVNIKPKHHKKRSGISLVLLLILLIAAGAYYAVDAGYLDVSGLELPFDLIER